MLPISGSRSAAEKASCDVRQSVLSGAGSPVNPFISNTLLFAPITVLAASLIANLEIPILLELFLCTSMLSGLTIVLV